ncbi:hypothetical protein, partial [Escherichia coli]|uniref:hypothetical protein n=1 Tax=Escherichia coli TaxID=562 RepID=UPI001BDBCA54
DEVLPRKPCYAMCLICDLSRIIVVAIKQRIDDRQGGIVRIRLILICAGNEKKSSVNYFVVFSGYGLYAT